MSAEPSPPRSADQSRRTGSAGRARRAGLGIVVVLVIGVGVTVASALAPGSGLARAVGSGCASAATAHVGLVVDFGTVPSVAGAPSPAVETSCVPLSGSDERGSDVLAAAGHTLRWQGGLLCAIDGYPATGCGMGTPDGYQYWSYWHGGSSWSYSSVGPAGYRVSGGAVEGWRFVEGADSAQEGAPRFASSGPCPPPVAPPPATAGAPPAARPGAAVTGAGAAPPTSAPSGAGAGATGSPPPAVAPTSSPTGRSSDEGAESRAAATTVPRTRSVALGAGPFRRPDPTSPAGALGAAGAIVALALAALVITRHRALG